ncbi:glycosyltransferase family 4 protein [Neiella sp. HB171785]|uniref:Glycosyltransferase family 4 protein n=1 Tax=Neiella litorisoli TaxID=2771431 RepID=A0A8J6UJF8_9GAMM|nr:glycosyltransferase family 4 protein [Neiella litorisoli]MBD1390558.1 glycosyltransferase family 4 protein [Neiella litorisoli]
MKVCFKLIEAGSGSDVWTYNMAKSLQAFGVDTQVDLLPHHYQYYPDLIGSAMAKTDADIVHTNSWNGFRFAQSGVKLVTTEHLVVHDPLIRPYKSFAQARYHNLVRWYEQRAFAAADAITAVSQYTAGQVKHCFGVQAQAIQNGIDVEQFYPQTVSDELVPQARDKIKLLFVGNFTRRKGADLLPHIMEQLGDRFVLLTTSGLQDKRVAESKQIISIGRLNAEQLRQFYNYADIFLFPTRLEGLSLTTIEAMACGMPVVTTDCFSMPELIVDRQGGFLCQQDSVDHFVQSIQTLAESSALRRQYGEFNRSHVESRFSLTGMVQQYVDLYQGLLA